LVTLANTDERTRMTGMAKALVAAVLMAGCANYEGPTLKWSKVDYSLEGAFVLETVYDGIQSRAIVAKCFETNPIIGDCGNRVPLGVYIPLSIIVQAGVAAFLPSDLRTAWLGLTTGAEADVVYTNMVVNTDIRSARN
jgi:hypothetical protein